MAIGIDEVDYVLKILDMIREDAIKNQEYGFEYDWVNFMKVMRLLTSQSSGARIQNYIFKKLGWTKVSPALNCGDVKNSLGQYFEVKISTITTSNKTANIVQIRLWQKISGYHIFITDSTNDYNLNHFYLSKSEMKDEVKLAKATQAHGTKEAMKNNENIEYAIHFKWSELDPTYKRWVSKYLQDTNLTEEK